MYDIGVFPGTRSPWWTVAQSVKKMVFQDYAQEQKKEAEPSVDQECEQMKRRAQDHAGREMLEWLLGGAFRHKNCRVFLVSLSHTRVLYNAWHSFSNNKKGSGEPTLWWLLGRTDLLFCSWRVFHEDRRHGSKPAWWSYSLAFRWKWQFFPIPWNKSWLTLIVQQLELWHTIFLPQLL